MNKEQAKQLHNIHNQFESEQLTLEQWKVEQINLYATLKVSEHQEHYNSYLEGLITSKEYEDQCLYKLNILYQEYLRNMLEDHFK